MWRRRIRTPGQILQTKVSTRSILYYFHSNTECRLDVHEDTEKNVVTATFEFPGFSKDDVQIDFQNGKLTVSAESKKSNPHDTGYTLNERLHGKFARTLQLPQGVQVCHSFLKNLLGWMSTDGQLMSHRVNRSKRRWKMVFWLSRSQSPRLNIHQRKLRFRPRIKRVNDGDSKLWIFFFSPLQLYPQLQQSVQLSSYDIIWTLVYIRVSIRTYTDTTHWQLQLQTVSATSNWMIYNKWLPVGFRNVQRIKRGGSSETSGKHFALGRHCKRKIWRRLPPLFQLYISFLNLISC